MWLVACTAGASRFVYICELVGCMRGSPATPCSRARGPRANAAGAREARHACAAVRARRPPKGTPHPIQGARVGGDHAAGGCATPRSPFPILLVLLLPCSRWSSPPSPPMLVVRRVRRAAACLGGGKGRDGKERGDPRCFLYGPWVVRPLALRLLSLSYYLRVGRQTPRGFLSKDWNGRIWTCVHGTTW